MSSPSCHLCGHLQLHEVASYSGYRRITSDFRLWPAKSRLAVCMGCGTAQKVADDNWRAECRSIYATYVVYRQGRGKGSEQAVFASSGAGEARSQALLRRLVDRFDLPTDGRHLDFGCGDGSLLRHAAALLPAWSRAGAELNEERRPEIEAIAGVREFYAGSLHAVPPVFDLVTAVHVLEHFENPAEILSILSRKLRPEGRLVIEVPDLRSNPFDLVIADHATHFTMEALDPVLAMAGLAAECLTDAWIARELSVVARPSGARSTAAVSWRDTVALVEHHLDWLSRLCQAVRDEAARWPIGLFGTSIAATWVAAHVGDAIAFFVDEDPQRVGTDYLGRPILHPDEVAPGSSVFLAHTPSFARTVMPRLERRADIRLIAPPKFNLASLL